MGVEYYELVAGTRGPSDRSDGVETDLFAGLPVAAAASS